MYLSHIRYYSKSCFNIGLILQSAQADFLCVEAISIALYFVNLYCLHGFNAVYLPEIGWYRVDARGNRENINAQFTPPQEQLAFKTHFPEEADFKTIFPEPLPVVVKALQNCSKWDEMLVNLPDISIAGES